MSLIAYLSACIHGGLTAITGTCLGCKITIVNHHCSFTTSNWRSPRALESPCGGRRCFSSCCPTDGCGCSCLWCHSQVRQLLLSISIGFAYLPVSALTSPRFKTFESQGRFFINPGSATGAWTGQSQSSDSLFIHPSDAVLIDHHFISFLREETPSFALMDVQGSVVVTYVYRLAENEVKVEKIEWRKPSPSERSQVNGSSAAALGPRSPVPPPSAPRDIPPSTSAWA